MIIMPAALRSKAGTVSTQHRHTRRARAHGGRFSGQSGTRFLVLRLLVLRTCGAQERSIDVSLSADLDGSGLIANDPDHNQFVDVSYFAQTRGGQRRKLPTLKNGGEE